MKPAVGSVCFVKKREKCSRRFFSSKRLCRRRHFVANNRTSWAKNSRRVEENYVSGNVDVLFVRLLENALGDTHAARIREREGEAEREGAKERARTLPDSFMSTNVAAAARSRAQSSESAEVCRRSAYSRAVAANRRRARRQRRPIAARRGDGGAKYSRYISRPVATANYPQLRAGDRRRRTWCERDWVTDELTSATERNGQSAWCAEKTTTLPGRCCCHRGCRSRNRGFIERSSRRSEVRENWLIRSARAALPCQRRSTCRVLR